MNCTTEASTNCHKGGQKSCCPQSMGSIKGKLSDKATVAAPQTDHQVGAASSMAGPSGACTWAWYPTLLTTATSCSAFS